MLKKKIFGFLGIFILLSVLTLPCLAELTKEDVRQIIREEIEPVKIDIAEMKGKMATKDDLLNMWKDMTGKVDTLHGNITSKIDALYAVTIGVLIAIIVAILSIILPPVIQRWFEQRKVGKDEERFQKIEIALEELKKSIEEARRDYKEGRTISHDEVFQ